MKERSTFSPFPNDIRIRGGRVQLDGYPIPNVSPAREIVSAYVDAIDDSYTGFSTLPTVFMRFSRPPSFETIRLETRCERCQVPSETAPNCPSGCAKWLYRNYYLVNITPPADPADPAYMGYGEGHSFGMAITTGRGRYICHNWIALRPADNSPLRPGATYAVIVTDTANPGEGIRSGGTPLVKDDDFAKLIEGLASGDCTGAAEGDVDIENACRLPGYRWLADYLNDSTQPDYDPNWKDHIKAAAVFTTMRPEERFRGFREKILACSGDCTLLPDPIPEGVSENTSLSQSSFKVLDGRIKMPIFQQGTPPFATAGEGGEIVYDSEGRPRLVSPPNPDLQLANFSLSLPQPPAVKPAGGWPVVIFMHEALSNPSARANHEFVRRSVAELLASVDVELGSPPVTQTASFAVLSLEGVMHGGRAGAAGGTKRPASLFYNLLNPYAARDNILQAAADGYQLIRLIRLIHQTYVEGGSLPGLEGVDLDPNQIYLVAHAEGARVGLIFTAFEPLIRAAVISQVGGPVSANLLTQAAPLDFRGALEVMTADRELGVMHPTVSLMQMFFDPVDPINYGRLILRDPPEVGESGDPPALVKGGPHHLFVVFGRDDAAAPEASMRNLLSTFGIQQFDNDPRDCLCATPCDAEEEDGMHYSVCTIGGLQQVAAPIRGNVTSEGRVLTSAVAMFYDSGGAGGHYLLFDSDAASLQYSSFLASGVLDPEGIPTIYAP